MEQVESHIHESKEMEHCLLESKEIEKMTQELKQEGIHTHGAEKTSETLRESTLIISGENETGETLIDQLESANPLHIHRQVSDLISDIEKRDFPKHQRAELMPVPSDNFPSYVTLGITTAAIAAGAYLGAGSIMAIGTKTVFRRLAVAYAISHASDASKRIQFLYPLWGESSKDAQERVDELVQLSENSNFTFKCFYIEVV